MADIQMAVRMNYDDIADVLYVTIGDGAPARYEEDDEEEGVIWRYSAAGVRFGVTLLDFHEYWGNRVGKFLEIID